MIVILAKLHRGQLRKAEKKVGKIITSSRHLLGRLSELRGHQLRRVVPGEGERAPRIRAAFSVELDAAEIATPPPTVLAMSPDHVVGKRISLIAQKLRIDVLQTRNIAKRNIRQPPVERIG